MNSKFPSTQALINALLAVKSAAEAQGVAAVVEAGQVAGGFFMQSVDAISLDSSSYSNPFKYHEEQAVRHMRVGTEDRLAWAKSGPALIRAMAGMPLRVVKDASWRWDQKNLTKAGGPTYVPRYQILILSAPGECFNPEPLCAEIEATTCAVDHWLADKQLFDWQAEQDQLKDRLFGSYRWTKEGFIAHVASKKKAEELVALVTTLEGVSAEIVKSTCTILKWNVKVKLGETQEMIA